MKFTVNAAMRRVEIPTHNHEGWQTLCGIPNGVTTDEAARRIGAARAAGILPAAGSPDRTRRLRKAVRELLAR